MDLDRFQERDRRVAQLQEMLVEGRIDRRQFVGRALGLGVSFGALGTLIAACGDDDDGAASQAPEFTAEMAQAKGDGSTVRVVGVATMYSAEQVKAFEEDTGYSMEALDTGLTDIRTKALTQADQWDVFDQNSAYMDPMWDAGSLRGIPVAAIPEWPDVIDLFKEDGVPGSAFGMPTSAVFADGGKQTLKGVPHNFNFEAMGVNRTKFPDLGDSYANMLDPKYKGRVSIWTDPLSAINWTALIEQKAGRMQVGELGNLTREEVDQVMKVLTDRKQDGQFRAFWNDYGQIVNLLASGEVVCADCWEPATIDAAGQAREEIVYVDPQEGNKPWHHFIGISSKAKNPKGALAYASWRLRGRAAELVAPNGYYSPNLKAAEETLAPELWDSTYGDKRIPGSYEERIKKAVYWWRWPRENQYYIDSWTTFLAS